MVKRKKAVTRRSFLRGAAAAVAAPAVVPASVLGGPGKAAPSDTVALSHIGVGGRGSGLFGSFLGCRGSRTVAICDAFQSRREGRAKQAEQRYAAEKRAGTYKGCTPYRDLREMLARTDIDACVIATQDHWHVVAAMMAVKAGKDVYVEKPLGVAMKWNFAFRDAVRQHGAIFQYGTQQRSSHHCRLGCELVRSGRIGKVHTIEVVAPNGRGGGSTQASPPPADLDYDLWVGPAPMKPYTRDRCTCNGTYHIYDYALGFIAGWGAHPLDIAVWGSEPGYEVPVELEGTGVIPAEGLYDTVLNWNCTGRYANGVKFKFTPGGNLTVFRGDKGTVWISRGGWRTEPESLKSEVLGPGDVHLVRSRHHSQNFIDSVRTRVDPVAPIEAAVQSDTISHLGDIAIRTGRKIKYDPVKEEILDDATARRMTDRPLRGPWRL